MASATHKTRAQQLAGLLFKLNHRLNQLQASCGQGECNLSPQETRAVTFLGRCGPCRMKDLSDNLNLAVSSTTTLVDNLEAKEVVARVRSDSDRRVVRVQLTDEGAKDYQATAEVYLGVARQILESHDEAAQDSLIETFGKIAG